MSSWRFAPQSHSGTEKSSSKFQVLDREPQKFLRIGKAILLSVPLGLCGETSALSQFSFLYIPTDHILTDTSTHNMITSAAKLNPVRTPCSLPHF